MSLLQSSLALVLCLSFSAACGDNWEHGDEFGGVDGSVSFPDAAGFPDASPPDAEPDAGPLDDLPIDLACSIEEILPVFECVFTNCADSFADGTALACVALNCGLLLFGLSPECSQCVLAGLSDPASALDSCLLGLDDLDLPMPPTP